MAARTTITTFSGLFYAGYGAIITPAFGVRSAYGNDDAQYNNALGFFYLLWAVLVFAFFVASIATNLVDILTYLSISLGFIFSSASYFASADGLDDAATTLKKVGGGCCLLAGLLGW
ncbi:hypothetical protein NQ176_g8827 [Zarea fungicola]|uniref:Uncharacterized protein n=1 Tax=Zarea fungicola TaxID=93591 RepID=A0ACC1MQ55_9HYPO|nr:hypothetical protein NQ176_g8827 [Lecanicillium fungicola]